MSRIKRYSKSTSIQKEVVKWYEGQGSTTTTLAKIALRIITTHKLTARLYGGAENTLQDLEDLETPNDPTMAKIKNKAYTLSMDDSKIYANCLNESEENQLRQKSLKKNSIIY